MASKKPKPETNKAFAWQDSKLGLAVVTLLNLFIVYIFGSLALRNGSVVGYFFAALFLALAVAQGIRLYQKVSGGE